MNVPSNSQRADHRTQALAAIDAVIAAPSDSVQPAAVELTKAVVRLRDTLIRGLRAGDASARRELDHVNALLSFVVSVQYPMQGQQREKVEKARQHFQKLIEELGEG